jgi:CO/xanthine dehydrogenase FAD-binding subunit
VKPPPFDWVAPETVEEALAHLSAHGDEARILAGGQSLIPVLNFRLARPGVLIDLNHVSSLAGIADSDRGLRIGAMTRQRRAERDELVARRTPLLSETLPHVAHPQIRNRGTVGGSLAHADPAAELPATMLALESAFRVRSVAGERTIPARDFFTGLFSTALGPEEMLVEISVPPLPARTGHAFEEVARRHGDFALLAVAAIVVLDAAGRCSDARLAFVNAGETARRSPAAEGLLVGEAPSRESVRAAAEAALADLDPVGDVHASAEFRRQLARVLAVRALDRALSRAKHESETAGA